MSKKSASKKEIEMKRFFALLSLLLRNWCWKIFEYIEKLLHPLRAVDRDKNAYGSLPHRILNTSNGFSITHKKRGRHLRKRVCNAKCIADLLELFVKVRPHKTVPFFLFISLKKSELFATWTISVWQSVPTSFGSVKITKTEKFVKVYWHSS